MNAAGLLQTQSPIDLNRYRPHHLVVIETSRYRLKTATGAAELEEICRLRHGIFLGEEGVETGDLDVDEFDLVCDHLVIEDKGDGRLVGTYRMLSSEWTDRFYSQGEFTLNKFLASPGVKLELGRACIHPDHRNGAVIDLLWKGIGEYARLTGANQLFGCSSVKTTCKKVAAGLCAHLALEGMVEDSFGISPTPNYDMGIDWDEPYLLTGEEKNHLPPLLRSYLGAGARVHGAPAFDEPFACIDFLTVLDLANVSPSYARRYFQGAVPA